MSLRPQVSPGFVTDWHTADTDPPLFATPGWLRAMAHRLGPSPVTLTVTDDAAPGVVLAATHGAVQRQPRPGEFFDLHHVLIGTDPTIPLTDAARAARAELAAAAPPPQRWVPNLTVMLPGYECHLVGPGRRDSAVSSTLVDGALRWADAEGLPTVAFLYTTPDAVELATALTARGFVHIPLSLTWDLHLPGSGLADYFAYLPHKRRIEARRERRLLRDAGVQVAAGGVTDIDAVFDRLVELRCRLVEKYRGRADPESEAAKLRVVIEDVAGGRPRVFTAVAPDGTVVGFAVFAEHQGSLLALAVGYDYDDPRARLAYFETAFYQAAETAYQEGIHTLRYGQGSWQAKRARGASGTELAGWFHSHDDDLTKAVRASAAVTELAHPGGQPTTGRN